MTKIALVTGVDSFTGAYVSAELRKNAFEVFGTSYSSESKSSKIKTVDLLDSRNLASCIENIKPNVVVHLAGISRVLHQDKSQIYQANIIGTRNLFEALSRFDSQLDSIIFPSSAQIYEGSDSESLDETSPISPKSDYAVSKYATEMLYRGMFRHLPVTIVRPFNYTGVGQTEEFIIPKMIAHFKKRAAKIELGNVDISRDFSDVRNVAWAYGQLCKNPAPGEVFNLASGRATSLEEIIERLKAISGHDISVNSDPRLFRSGEVVSIRGNAGKLWSHIGEPPHITLEETLEWMLTN